MVMANFWLIRLDRFMVRVSQTSNGDNPWVLKRSRSGFCWWRLQKLSPKC